MTAHVRCTHFSYCRESSGPGSVATATQREETTQVFENAFGTLTLVDASIFGLHS